MLVLSYTCTSARPAHAIESGHPGLVRGPLADVGGDGRQSAHAVEVGTERRVVSLAPGVEVECAIFGKPIPSPKQRDVRDANLRECPASSLPSDKMRSIRYAHCSIALRAHSPVAHTFAPRKYGSCDASDVKWRSSASAMGFMRLSRCTITRSFYRHELNGVRVFLHWITRITCFVIIGSVHVRTLSSRDRDVLP